MTVANDSNGSAVRDRNTMLLSTGPQRELIDGSEGERESPRIGSIPREPCRLPARTTRAKRGSMRSCGLGLVRFVVLASIVAAGCTAREPCEDSETTVAPLTTTTSLEAEALTRTFSAVGTTVTTAPSGEVYVQLNAGANVNDWIEFALPGLPAGSYAFTMFFKSHTTRGINQATLDGVNLGAPCDEYLTTQQFLVTCAL